MAPFARVSSFFQHPGPSFAAKGLGWNYDNQLFHNKECKASVVYTFTCSFSNIGYLELIIVKFSSSGPLGNAEQSSIWHLMLSSIFHIEGYLKVLYRHH